MGRIMPAIGCVKITRQASILTVRANVDGTINTVEPSANNVLLATVHTPEKIGRSIREERPTWSIGA